jgi:hypothetical protein
MPMHEVKAGECLSVIARRNGFSDIRKIYDHPQNADFKKKRPDPDVLSPGDRIFIPDPEPKKTDCAAYRKHRFRARFANPPVRLLLKDAQARPLAWTKFTLDPDGQAVHGVSDGEGKLEFTPPPGMEEMPLILWEEEIGGTIFQSFRLRIGHLDPVEETSGLQGRLINLGYAPGSADGKWNESWARLLAAFQLDQGIDATGEPDDATRKKLLAACNR